jgi:hypothetical protein
MKRSLVILSAIALIIPIAIVIQKTELKMYGHRSSVSDTDIILLAQKDDKAPQHRGSGR